MAAHDDAQERTEQATPKRLQDAREKGQIARSRELATVFVLLGGAGALHLSGGHLLDALGGLMQASFAPPRTLLMDDRAGATFFVARLVDTLIALAPLLGVAVLMAIAGPLALGGWNLSLTALLPKFDRLDPLQGLKRVFGPRGLAEMLKALFKFVLVLALLLAALQHYREEILGLARGDVRASLALGASVLYRIFLVVCLATVLVALVDVPFQAWQHARQLRMSRQELRDEMKETDGSPEMRGRLRAMQAEVARRRMMEEVPKADVVLTNPTHYAVALRFDPATMRAPLVVAKGVEDVARNIRAVAERNGVLLMESPPLARALYHTTKVNREIPAGLYVAVARVLAYVFQLRAGNRDLEQPNDLPIPPELSY